MDPKIRSCYLYFVAFFSINQLAGGEKRMKRQAAGTWCHNEMRKSVGINDPFYFWERAGRFLCCLKWHYANAIAIELHVKPALHETGAYIAFNIMKFEVFN